MKREGRRRGGDVERLIAKREIEAAAEALVAIGASWDEAKYLMTRAVLDKALDKTKGNISRAARLLKMHRNTFTRQIERRA
jgi:ActR/RegA family two-component response regulator